MTGRTYLIWSHEHSAWWGPSRMGYVNDITRAGRYSQDEACTICAAASIAHDWSKGGPNELPVAIDDLPDAARVILGEL